MKSSVNRYLLLAIGLALLFHGSAVFYTIEKTYDALIHLFFAEHYASNWQEPWSYKWYTGFSTMGYPPLVHQTLGILSFVGGHLKFGLFTFPFFIILLFVTGVYRFSLLITENEDYAGFAAIFSVFSSVFVETLHLFGQLPTLTGISLLMHSFPEIYNWIRTARYRYLVSSILLMSLMICSHHVTPIFGMVFFIFPLIGLGVMDNAKEAIGNYKDIRLVFFLKHLIKSIKPIAAFGILSLITMIGCILPYWINTKNNPITQVPIPHGSRDNFFEVLSSGLVFFVIPYGVVMTLFPFLFYRFFCKRLIFFGLSFAMLFILGTGGTTPLALLILGENAFNILTLDRFTFWASIMSYPLLGEFFYRFAKSDYRDYLIRKFGKVYYVCMVILIGAITAYFTIFTTNLGKFRPSQPASINMLPIINFLSQDMHYKWRYLTLGFGDQMAWLSSQTIALSVDGNYHSARRLPELTTKAVERLENCKFRGFEGIGSLQQFLANSGRFNLKYIFSNDKFYDPILFFTGWEKLSYLENGIMVWEKKNVAPLPKILKKIDIPKYQKIIWSFVPVTVMCLNIFWTITVFFFFKKPPKKELNYTPTSLSFSKVLMGWNIFVFLFTMYGVYLFYIKNSTQISAINVVKAYYDALDFKEFIRAHSYLDKNGKKSLDQFMLEISVTDGLLSSYAKLEELKTEVIKEDQDTVFIKAKTKWITPLESIKKERIIKAVPHKGKWWIVPDPPNPYIPANQFIDVLETKFYNQGRRKITTQQTHHEDILPQPVAFVHQAKLIKRKNQYHVVGELQNIDYFPSAINLKAILYDENDVELATYSSKFQNKHYLNPYEKTSFKVDFEEVAWINSDKKNQTFNPDEFHPKVFKKVPSKFVLHISSTVVIKNLYQSIQINNLEHGDNEVSGYLFNAGYREVTIPQLLVSYFDDNNEIYWVDHSFLKESVRPHRRGDFRYAIKNTDGVEVIVSSTENCYVNGVENSKNIDRLDGFDANKNQHVMIENNNNKLKIQVANFIGN